MLEGLRRLDENIAPSVAFPADYVPEPDELESAPVESSPTSEVEKSFAPAFLAFGKESMTSRKPLFIGAIVVAILGSVAVIGVPAGWYSSKKAEAAPSQTVTQTPAPQNTQAETQVQPQATTSEAQPTGEDPAELAARRQREKERRAREAAKAAENPAAAASAPTPETAKPGAKRVVVTVTYDESGRVTQASGGDANALRIARQKRFPPGKAGSATVSIPIN